MKKRLLLALLSMMILPECPARAQAASGLQKDSSPGQAQKAQAPARVTTQPPAQVITDAKTHLIFDLPAGWNSARRDGEISTFHLDARTAPRTADLRLVASLAYNPYPSSTFSGALFYLSVTPRSTTKACAAQTSVKPDKPLARAVVADLNFNRGIDERGHICTEARTVTYTSLHKGACLRFDLVVNNFCGGEVSGVRDMTEAELASIFKRLEDILGTVRITSE